MDSLDVVLLAVLIGSVWGLGYVLLKLKEKQ
jgi:hypothetical protein